MRKLELFIYAFSPCSRCRFFTSHVEPFSLALILCVLFQSKLPEKIRFVESRACQSRAILSLRSLFSASSYLLCSSSSFTSLFAPAL